eukprot:scaffold13803_cov145-Cylindrotheca_fusiformis.AAC.1
MAWRSSKTANPILAAEAVVAAVEEDVVLVAATVAENNASMRVHCNAGTVELTQQGYFGDYPLPV